MGHVGEESLGEGEEVVAFPNTVFDTCVDQRPHRHAAPTPRPFPVSARATEGRWGRRERQPWLSAWAQLDSHEPARCSQLGMPSSVGQSEWRGTCRGWRCLRSWSREQGSLSGTRPPGSAACAHPACTAGISRPSRRCTSSASPPSCTRPAPHFAFASVSFLRHTCTRQPAPSWRQGHRLGRSRPPAAIAIKLPACGSRFGRLTLLARAAVSTRIPHPSLPHSTSRRHAPASRPVPMPCPTY